MNRSRRFSTRSVVALALAASAGVAGCGRDAAAPAPPAPAAAERGYIEPPRLQTAVRLRDGGALLSGQALPNARVRLASPSGRAFSAVADETGRFSLQAPAIDQPILFGLSAQEGGRTVQAEGYIALTPVPGVAAALLRAGAGAQVIGPVPSRPGIAAVDIDAAGAAAISGRAPAGANVAGTVDSRSIGQASAGATGHFAFALAQPLVAGPHRAEVRGPTGESAIDFQAANPVRPAEGPYSAGRMDNGWRFDWVTPGGGLQTSLIFDPAGAAG